MTATSLDATTAIHKTRTLLLIGGVFGSGLLAWFLATHRLVRVPTDVPIGAAAVLRIENGWPEELAPGASGEKTVAVLPDSDAEHGFRFEFEYVPARLAFIPKPYGGAGLAVFEGRKLPLLAQFDGTAIRIRVGKEFRGLKLNQENEAVGPKLKVIPSGSAVYYMDPNPSRSLRILDEAGFLHGSLWDNWGFGGIFRWFRGPTEVAILGGKESFQDFILHSAPGTGGFIDTSPLDFALKDAVGRAAPDRVKIALQDSSVSTELRSSAGEVSLKERQMNSVITKRFSSSDGAVALSYAIDEQGHLWMGNDTDILKEAVTRNPALSAVQNYSCSGNPQVPQVVIYPQKLWKKTFLSIFSAVALSFDDLETGLFTICGYI